jgi:Mg2+/Co2+ transporter CorB
LLDVPTAALTAALIALVALSAFLSGTETALMSANRDRLRHYAREGSRGARAAARLLERPDRLVGLILICNNIVNTVAASIVTLLCF